MFPCDTLSKCVHSGLRQLMNYTPAASEASQQCGSAARLLSSCCFGSFCPLARLPAGLPPVFTERCRVGSGGLRVLKVPPYQSGRVN